MDDPFLAKIMRDGLSRDDAAFIGDSYRGVYQVAAQADIASENPTSKQVHILLEGWAYKYRLVADGRRQILRVHLPGEICDLDKIFNDDPGFGVLAVCDCRVAAVSLDWIKKAVSERPAIRDILWSLTVLENIAMSEQVVSLGRRTARERAAFFLCDLLDRLQALGQALDNSFRLPITQVDMGDHLGLSTVHINRTLQDLKSERLIHNSGRTYRISDRDGLERMANFSRAKRHHTASSLSQDAAIA